MSDIQTDIDTGEILIENGDFVIGEADDQELKSLIESAPGTWREFPTVGLGAFKYLKAQNPEQRFVSRLKEELKKDKKSQYKVTLIDGIRDFSVDGEPSNKIQDIQTGVPEGAALYDDTIDPEYETVKVSDGDTIYDLAIRHYGAIEGCINIFELNPDLSFDTDLVSGSSVVIDKARMLDADTVKLFQS